jgi:hypothetical protein
VGSGPCPTHEFRRLRNFVYCACGTVRHRNIFGVVAIGWVLFDSSALGRDMVTKALSHCIMC